MEATADDLHLPAGNPAEADPVVEQSADDAPSRRGWAGWLISLALHALLLLIMYGIYWVVKDPDTETPPVRVAMIDPPPKQEEKPKTERTLETTVELNVEAESETPAPITALELPVEDSQREEDQDNPVPKGREEAVADSEMGGSGAFMAIGAGGGSAGMFGSRSGGGRKRAVGKYGGSKGSEAAVESALRWFKKHQGADGGWDAEHYQINCTEDPKCEPGLVEHGSKEGANIAMTGYALLCFLGAGYDHQTPNKYRQVVAKGIDRLLAVQKPGGELGERNYEHPIATMALAEAFAMTGDPKLKAPAQKGVDIILARQNHDPLANGGAGVKDAKEGYGAGLGWDYIGASDRNDSSVTGWNVMALKSALAGGLNVGNGLEGARVWLERVWKATNADWAKIDPYTGESRFPYTWNTTTGKVSFGFTDNPAEPPRELSCVGAVCAVFLGPHAGDAMLESLCSYIDKKQIPVKYPCNTYYMYYSTLAIFQAGGEHWKRWNTQVRDLLVNAQRRGSGCFDGSWDYADTVFPGHKTGRVLSTAYCCLSLEVYYRYAQVAGKH